MCIYYNIQRKIMLKINMLNEFLISLNTLINLLQTNILIRFMRPINAFQTTDHRRYTILSVTYSLSIIRYTNRMSSRISFNTLTTHESNETSNGALTPRLKPSDEFSSSFSDNSFIISNIPSFEISGS